MTTSKDMLGMANREVCNVTIRDLATGAPFMRYEYANTTGINLTSDNVYARAHGTNKIAFNNPMEGEVTIAAQVLPWKVYSLYSDSTMDNKADVFHVADVESSGAGTIALAVNNGTIVEKSVYVYKMGDFGGKQIEGNFSGDTFTATHTEEIKEATKYSVGFMVAHTSGVSKIALNNKKLPKDISIDMDTIFKDENGNFVPMHISVKKATIVRNLDLSFSSEGDPVETTLTFSVLEKNADEFVDIVEITEPMKVNGK